MERSTTNKMQTLVPGRFQTPEWESLFKEKYKNIQYSCLLITIYLLIKRCFELYGFYKKEYKEGAKSCKDAGHFPAFKQPFDCSSGCLNETFQLEMETGDRAKKFDTKADLTALYRKYPEYFDLIGDDIRTNFRIMAVFGVPLHAYICISCKV